MAQKKRSPSPYTLVKKFRDGWYYRLGSSSSYPWLGPFETEHVANKVREGATGGAWGYPRGQAHARIAEGSVRGTTTAEAKRELAKLRTQFEAQGGRGVDLAERIDALEAYLGDESIQESAARKEDWLRGAKRRFPMSARVRVVGSDVPEYIGAKGTVMGYDIGTGGGWPLVSVKFDTPIRHGGRLVERDGFYGDGSSDDEIVPDRSGKTRAKRSSAKRKPAKRTKR